MNKYLLAIVVAAGLWVSPALAGSTINPSAPAQNSALSSAPVRSNFQAAYNDVNNILGCFAGTSAPQNPSTFQYWCDTTSSPTQVVVNQYDGAQWVATAYLDQTTHTFSSSITINPSLAFVAGQLGINLTHSNVLAALQSISLNAAALQSPQTGTLLQLGQANGVNTRIELDSYAAVPRYTCVREDGTAASPTTIQSGDELCSLNAFGYNGSAVAGPQAAIRTYAAQNWTTGAAGTYLRIGVTADGGTTLADAISVENDGGVTLGSLVGAANSKGAGTINLVGLYLSGTQAATTVNGQTCLIGGTCSITASTTSIQPGVTTITSGTPGDIEYNNGGTLGEKAVTGSGSVVLGTSPTIATPTLSGAIAGTYSLGGTPSIAGSAINSGTVSATYLPTATSGAKGVVQGDGSTLPISAGIISCVTATTSQIGCSKPDGSTIVVTSGVLTAVGAAATSIAVGTTTVSGGTNNYILTYGTGTLADATIASLLTAGTGISVTGTTNATIALNLGATNTWTGLQTLSGGATVTGSFTATGLVTDADLAATVGSGSVVLSSGPSISALTVTSSFTATGLVTAADLAAVTGSGSVVLASSPTIVTPTIAQVNGNGGAYLNLQGNPVINAASGDAIYFEQATTQLFIMTSTSFYASIGETLGSSSYPWGALWVTLPSTSAALDQVCYNSSTKELSYDGSSCLTSSLRYKRDVEPLTNNLDVVSRIDAISFEYDDQSIIAGRQDGVSAESLAGADPLLVSYDDRGRPDRPRPLSIIGRLVGAVRELNVANSRLQSEIDQLRASR